MKKNSKKREEKKARPLMFEGHVITQAQAAVLNRAAQLALGDWRDRLKARNMARDLRRLLREAAEAEAVKAGIAETVALETARATAAGTNGKVVVEEQALRGSWARDDEGFLHLNDHGLPIFREEKVVRQRIKTRDGLKSLAKTGTLSAAMERDGMAYRLLVEHVGAGMRSCLAERAPGSSPDARRRASELQHAYQAARLHQIERSVGAGTVELEVLQLVAAEGYCIGSIAEGGAARKAATEALKRALALVAKALRSPMDLTPPDREGRAAYEEALRIAGS